MTQAEAIIVMNSGANVFLTGAPGAGKTYTLNQFIEAAMMRGRRIAITASTGIAASHIDGVTIHSWSGTGIKEKLLPFDYDKINNGRAGDRIREAQVLVIDEVSMLHDYRLDMVNSVCKAVRGTNKPFGGLQVILVGDMYQLPPVQPGSSTLPFVHHARAWSELDLKMCYVTEQHRQAESDGLLEFLIGMRERTVNPHLLAPILKRRMIAAPDEVTRLYTHNVDVDALNSAELRKLPGEPTMYKMTESGQEYKIAALKKGVLAPEELFLKVGAEVLFVANNFDDGYVNGTRGRVVEMGPRHVTVATPGGDEVVATKHTWRQLDERGKVLAEVSQIPLRLAWAITVHKSQGLSLDAAVVDLAKAFTPGMGYVALSRVRSLDGLYLTGLNDQAMLMHEEIHALDAELRAASASVVVNNSGEMVVPDDDEDWLI